MIRRERNWTLRETRADYFNSRVDEDVTLLNFAIKRRTGVEESVGRFRFDWARLAERGLVHRHVEGGRPRYVVQINHVNGARFTLGVRPENQAPLSEFATEWDGDVR